MGVLQTGDIIFIRGRGIISNTIRAIDRGEFSHVAVALSDTHVIEAEWNTKSIIKPFEHEDYEIVTLMLTDEQKDRLIKRAIQLTGMWYDYPQLLGYMFKGAKYGTPKRLICSEVAYELLLEVGIDVMDRNISPNKLYSYLKKDTLKDGKSVTLLGGEDS